MNIGILYPQSAAHPSIMTDFMGGIEAALGKDRLSCNYFLHIVNVGFGGIEKEVYEKAEKLLSVDKADILVAFIDMKVLEILKPLIYSSGKLLLVINPGANFPQNWVPQPNIIHLTLMHGFLCWLSGRMAAETGNLPTAMATSFYDCGYLHCASIVKGLNFSGGQISFNYISNQPYNEAFAIDQLTGYLDKDKETRNLICLFDSLPGALFYSRLGVYKDADKLHLFVSPMMLEQEALMNFDQGNKFSVEGYLPWQPGMDNQASRFFEDTYKLETKRDPNIFSLLGWEAGLILKELFPSGSSDYTDGSGLAKKLTRIKIDSPRGDLKLDPQTNYFISPFIKYRLKEDQKESNPVLLSEMEEQWSIFKSEKYEETNSGWTNTYLCY